MPTAGKVHHFLRPQGAQQRNLLRAAPSPVVKIAVQGFIFHIIPADAHAQAQAAAAQHIHRRGLLGDQGGGPLRQD